jgi:murein DD-endopeptidase MepM/ murein hydrolase activator NlpD
VRKLSWMILLLLVACASSAEDVREPVMDSATSAPTQTSTAIVVAQATATAPPTTTTTAPSATPTATSIPQPALSATWSYPIGLPNRAPGDGFFIRHGYITENTWYNPGYWHTGEDWYALDGETAGAGVYAVADGEVVYAGSNYPGRVVMVRHAGDLYSMYGHLDPALRVEVGAQVTRGQQLGTVLARGDDVPDHLHFEMRTFLTTAEVNGDRPRYDFRCGPNCVPGPGYWPIAAPELPTALGWRNPTHVINRRAFPAAGNLGEVVVAAPPGSLRVTLWADVAENGAPQQAQGEIALEPGARLPLLEVRSGPEATEASSAQSYVLWYRVRLADGREGWVAAAVPSDVETGGDGRPSTTRFNLLPARNNQQESRAARQAVESKRMLVGLGASRYHWNTFCKEIDKLSPRSGNAALHVV